MNKYLKHLYDHICDGVERARNGTHDFTNREKKEILEAIHEYFENVDVSKLGNFYTKLVEYSEALDKGIDFQTKMDMGYWDYCRAVNRDYEVDVYDIDHDLVRMDTWEFLNGAGEGSGMFCGVMIQFEYSDMFSEFECVDPIGYYLKFCDPYSIDYKHVGLQIIELKHDYVWIMGE